MYEAKVSTDTKNKSKRYLGASETPFKERFRNHTKDFKHKKYEKYTELSKYISNLKSQGIRQIVKWSIVKRVKSSVSYSKLCLTENFYIIRSLNNKNLINKKYHLVNKRRHQNKLLLTNVRINDSMD